MVNGLKYWQYLLFKSSILVLMLVAEHRVTFVVNVRQV